MSSVVTSRNSHVSVDGTLLLATKWTVEIRADEIDITNFESGGFTEQETGYIDATITFDAFWECNLNIFEEDPPQIIPGTKHNVKCYIRGTPARAVAVPAAAVIPDEHFTFTCAKCITCNVTSAVRDVARYDAVFRNNGEFTLPGEVSPVIQQDCITCVS